MRLSWSGSVATFPRRMWAGRANASYVLLAAGSLPQGLHLGLAELMGLLLALPIQHTLCLHALQW